MSCTNCRNTQCYVCGKNVKDYRHFTGNGGGSRKGCPLHDNTDQRHQDEVKKAEQEAVKKVKDANPGLAEEELRVKMSEQVKHENGLGKMRPVQWVNPEQLPGFPVPFPPFPGYAHPVEAGPRDNWGMYFL